MHTVHSSVGQCTLCTVDSSVGQCTAVLAHGGLGAGSSCCLADEPPPQHRRCSGWLAAPHTQLYAYISLNLASIPTTPLSDQIRIGQAERPLVTAVSQVADNWIEQNSEDKLDFLDPTISSGYYPLLWLRLVIRLCQH